MSMQQLIIETLKQRVNEDWSDKAVWNLVTTFQRGVEGVNYTAASDGWMSSIIRSMYREVSWPAVYEALVKREEVLPVITWDSPIEDVKRVLDAGYEIQCDDERIWKTTEGFYWDVYRTEHLGGAVEKYSAGSAWSFLRQGNDQETFSVVRHEA